MVSKPPTAMTSGSSSHPQPGKPGVYTANLGDVPSPPAGGTSHRTGMATIDETRTDTMFYPLSVTDLATSTGTNNVGVWDSATYLTSSDATYGLPADSGIGMGVNGQSIFPVYNNNVQYTPGQYPPPLLPPCALSLAPFAPISQ